MAWHEPYLQLLKQTHQHGKQVQRVRVIPRPSNNYFRFEFKIGYQANLKAGEDIRLIDRSIVARPDTPLIDFWLFDDDLVALLRYDKRGRLLDTEYYDDKDYLERMTKFRDGLLEHSTPLSKLQLRGYQVIRQSITVRAVRREPVDTRRLAQALQEMYYSLSPEEREALRQRVEHRKRNGETT